MSCNKCDFKPLNRSDLQIHKASNIDFLLSLLLYAGFSKAKRSNMERKILGTIVTNLVNPGIVGSTN